MSTGPIVEQPLRGQFGSDGSAVAYVPPEGAETTTMILPKAVTLQLDDGVGVRTFQPGIQEVESSLANHWWLEANGAVKYTRTPAEAAALEKERQLRVQAKEENQKNAVEEAEKAVKAAQDRLDAAVAQAAAVGKAELAAAQMKVEKVRARGPNQRSSNQPNPRIPNRAPVAAFSADDNPQGRPPGPALTPSNVNPAGQPARTAVVPQANANPAVQTIKTPNTFGPDLSKMTKDQLAEHAYEEHDLDLDAGKMSRDELVAAVERARAAGK